MLNQMHLQQLPSGQDNQKMSDSNEIRESLLKIKKSQAELLRELRSEHDALQGYLTSNCIPQGSPLRQNNLFECTQCENSLELSRSQGNAPRNVGKVTHRSTTTGAEDILENNYKKIEELLLKQRKMYEENHSLQQENQSLLEDYRQLKKLYYELKQTNRSNLITGSFLLNQIIYQCVRDLLLEVPNNEIAEKVNKTWNRFKIQHPKLLTQTDINQHFSEQSDRFLQKILALLDQDCKLRASKTKQQQIQQLKERIAQLRTINDMASKNKQQLVLSQEKRYTSLSLQNNKLTQKIKAMEMQLVQIKSQNLNKLKYLQTQIIHKCKEIQQINKGLKRKDDDIDKYKEMINRVRIEHKTSADEIENLKKEVQSTKTKLKEKEDILQNQIQLNKKQNSLVERMSREMTDIRNHIEGSSQRRGESQTKLWLQNQGLTKELTVLKQDFEKYRQSTQKEISSLATYNKQIKSQHDLLIKSQENSRVNEMRYRELVATKQANMKLTSNVDHLWSIKEIEYGNVMEALVSLK